MCKSLQAELDEERMREMNKKMNKEMNEEVKDMENDKITISMEEYKELLMIKGRYEELKEKRREIGKKEDDLWNQPYTVTLL